MTGISSLGVGLRLWWHRQRDGRADQAPGRRTGRWGLCLAVEPHRPPFSFPVSVKRQPPFRFGGAGGIL